MLDAPSQRVSARPNPPPPRPSVYSVKPDRLHAAARDLLNSLSRGRGLTAGPRGPATMLDVLQRVAALEPSHSPAPPGG